MRDYEIELDADAVINCFIIADTRTGEHDALGLALLQHQHAGILPSSLEALADSNAASLSSSLPTTTSNTAGLAWNLIL